VAIPDAGGWGGAGPRDAPAADADALGGEIRRYYRSIAPFLDQELADRGDGPFWTWAASHPPSCRVLELGCGTGRATAFLAQAAARVVALDLSLDLLARARGRLAGRRNVALIGADMRRVALRREFDLVVAVDDPFVHLIDGADRDQALRAAALQLAPGGRLILDTAWFPPRQRNQAASPAGLVIERVHPAPGGEARTGSEANVGGEASLGGESGVDGTIGEADLTVREQWRCEPGSRLCTARYTYTRDGEIVAESSFRARLWSVAELLRRIRAAGLAPRSLWGDYDRRPWRRATSLRLIVEARR
jgi:SAM-dependent methyltransferase